MENEATAVYVRYRGGKQLHVSVLGPFWHSKAGFIKLSRWGQSKPNICSAPEQRHNIWKLQIKLTSRYSVSFHQDKYSPHKRKGKWCNSFPQLIASNNREYSFKVNFISVKTVTCGGWHDGMISWTVPTWAHVQLMSDPLQRWDTFYGVP